MDELNRDPREDISLIKEMLEKAMDDMKPIVPWFTGFGIVWLIYGGFSALQRVLIPNVPLSVAMILSRAGSIAGVLFCLITAVGYVACRRSSACRNLDSLAGKLLDLWGVCIFLYLLLTLLVNPVMQIAAAHSVSQQAAQGLYKACALCRSFLFFLFPAAPLLITARFLGSRKMFLAGILLAVLAAIVICSHGLLLFDDTGTMGEGLLYLWCAAACILDLSPGIMLLRFAHQLKER
ncbi:MAG: hypothetical protein IKE28_09045 [Solobacterium sp.]|nr:hypothetical protein [Solobacterium sp.]